MSIKVISVNSNDSIFLSDSKRGVTGNGRREVGQKSPLGVGGSRILEWDLGGLDFACQIRDVGGFVFRKLSPKQRYQNDTNQEIPSVNKARSD